MRECPQPELMPERVLDRCSYRSAWRSPWKPDKVRKNVCVTRWPVWVRGLRWKCGIYFVRDIETKQVLYVGRGRTCLKSALVRHFHAWSDDRCGLPHRRVLFDRERVEVKYWVVRRPEWVAAAEADSIAQYRPLENARGEVANRTYEDEVPF